MSLCIAAGKDTIAYGVCCVAVGDNCKSIGAYQVVTNETLTIPDGYATKQLREYMATMKLNLETYRCIEVQGFAPKGFHEKAEKALIPLMERLEKMIAKEEDKEEKS